MSKRKEGRAKDRDGFYLRRGYQHFEYKDPHTGKWRPKSTGKKLIKDAKPVKEAFLKALGTGRYTPGNDRMKFIDASGMYIKHREVSVAAGTLRLEKERLKQLQRLITKLGGQNLSLAGITIDLVRRYQQARIQEGVGPRTVNMEGQLLRSILKHHGQWKLDATYEPLPEPVSEAGRALTPEEEVRLLDAARSREEWFVAFHATVLENEAGMRGVEIRNLQLKRIDLKGCAIRLLKSKTKGGVRNIALTPDAIASVNALLQRASTLGAFQPEHYLLPARVDIVKTDSDEKTFRTRTYDPTKPTKGWRTAWRKLTAAAGLKGLRGHDLRHNWVTSHAEIGTPQSVLEEQAGHLSKRMSDHYKHISERAAQKAADELARVKAEQRVEARRRLAEQNSLWNGHRATSEGHPTESVVN